ncbi:MAG: 6,7-dimethyl-8-ribityllumazine synthase [Planctomycetota bacterium]
MRPIVTAQASTPLSLAPLLQTAMARDENSSDRIPQAPSGARFAFVVSEYHRDLCGAMLDSARGILSQAGVAEDDLEVAWVPGAFELPLVARRFARRRDIQAVMCFGLVLTGETSHDRYVSYGATEGLLRASFETDTPVLFGVLTCQTLEQARARALPVSAGGEQDKGATIARAALGVLHALEVADGISPMDAVGFPTGSDAEPTS